MLIEQISCSLWRTVDNLLGHGRMPLSDLIGVEIFSRCFAENVSKMWFSMSGATADDIQLQTTQRLLLNLAIGEC